MCCVLVPFGIIKENLSLSPKTQVLWSVIHPPSLQIHCENPNLIRALIKKIIIYKYSQKFLTSQDKLFILWHKSVQVNILFLFNLNWRFKNLVEYQKLSKIFQPTKEKKTSKIFTLPQFKNLQINNIII